MKNTITFFLVLLALVCNAQENDLSKIGLYTWKQAVLMQPCNLSGVDDTTTIPGAGGAPATTVTAMPILSVPGQQFRVIAVINGAYAIIQVLDYTDGIAKAPAGTKQYTATANFYQFNFKGTAVQYGALTVDEANSRNYGAYQRFFKVGINYIDALAKSDNRISGALAAGVINFPFKYRPQKGNADFSGTFNFGAGIGYKFRHKVWRKFTYSVLSGYSVSNVVLTDANTNLNQEKLTNTNDFTAFSFSLGLMAEYERVQAGIFMGWDRISKQNQQEYQWQYQGKVWFSVGFGLAIFTGQPSSSSGDSNGAQTHN